MTDSEYYRDAAKENIKINLDILKKNRCLVFGSKPTKVVVFDDIPMYGVTDDELQVITDNVIRILQQYQIDPRHAYLEVPENHRFYYRYVNAINDIFNQALVNIVGANRYINDEKFHPENSRIARRFSPTKPFITISDIIKSLAILKNYGIPVDEIENLRGSIILGIKLSTPDNMRTILL